MRVVIYFSRNLRLRDDQSGDNLYYMGFLFTLTSLGVSLYQFSVERAAEEIVQNFGIAIASTITGIALRVVFNQMRRDPVEGRAHDAPRARGKPRAGCGASSTARWWSLPITGDPPSRRRRIPSARVAEKFDDIVGKFQGTLEEITAKLARSPGSGVTPVRPHARRAHHDARGNAW